MDNSNFLKIAPSISKLRKEKGLTQKYLTEQVGVTNNAAPKWEQGLNCPDISILSNLSSILGVTLSELVNDKRAPSPAPEMDAAVESWPCAMPIHPPKISVPGVIAGNLWLSQRSPYSWR
jgi:transcriptional regulator with XRE-family HTH domain